MPQSTKSIVLLLASLTSLVPLSIDMLLPALPAIAGGLGASHAAAQSTVGTFLLGLCIGMLCQGPLSDHLGRRRLLLGGLLLYASSTAFCILAANIDQLIVARFFQALGGSAAAVLARAMVGDKFELNDAARMLTLMHLVTMVATLVAPILGSGMLALAGWRGIFYALLSFASLVGVMTLFQLAESLPRERRSRSVAAAFLAYLHVLRNPLAWAYMGCMGLSLGGMFAFITGSPFVYIEHFGLSPEHYAFLMAINILGIIAATLVNAHLVRRLGPGKMMGVGVLLTLMACAGLLHVALTPSLRMPEFVVLVALYIGATGLFGANSIACLMALFPGGSGAATGLAISMQFAIAALCSTVTAQVVGQDPGRLGLVMLITGVISACCYGFVLVWPRRAPQAS